MNSIYSFADSPIIFDIDNNLNDSNQKITKKLLKKYKTNRNNYKLKTMERMPSLRNAA
tara:strand:- start:1151 stop:1324 length:174 start_codon:yes stop_codon:yes gene_type:complete